MIRFVRAVLVAASALTLLTPTNAVAAPTSAATHGPVRAVSTADLAVMPARASAQASTSNWAGYQASVAGPQQVRGSWFVPRATWPGRDGYSSAWIGLGGGRPGQGELVQAGTESDSVCTAARSGRCTAWRTTYYAWIETYPSRLQERITNLPISPGDAIDVTVRWNAATRRTYFTLCNWRRNACVGTSRTSAAPAGVAEAVLERTADGSGRNRALANVGTVQFAGVEVKGTSGTRNLNAWPTRRLTMVNGSALATTSPITRYGDSFSVSYRRPI